MHTPFESSTETKSSVSASGDLLTVEDVAQMLKVPPSWVYDRTRLRTANRMPGFRLGKYWRFQEAEVLAWIERQRNGTKPND